MKKSALSPSKHNFKPTNQKARKVRDKSQLATSRQFSKEEKQELVQKLLGVVTTPNQEIDHIKVPENIE